jgi:hypothetical protein
VVPLVFKTSLGVVRSPEGSTPSLLRQDSYCNSTTYKTLATIFYIVGLGLTRDPYFNIGVRNMDKTS